MAETINNDFIRQLSIDCVIFGYQEGQLHVLVSRLYTREVFYGLPGGFIRQSEGIDEAAHRILAGRTGLTDLYLEQFRVFGGMDRYNEAQVSRMLDADIEVPQARAWIRANREWLKDRFISIGYYALVDMRKVTPTKTDIDASMEWCALSELPPLILDHPKMVREALLTLRRQLDEHLIAFNLLPEKFTMTELRLLYESVYDRPFPRNNFQKKILDLNVLDRLEKQFTGATNRAPYLYRYRRDR